MLNRLVGDSDACFSLFLCILYKAKNQKNKTKKNKKEKRDTKVKPGYRGA